MIIAFIYRGGGIIQKREANLIMSKIKRMIFYVIAGFILIFIINGIMNGHVVDYIFALIIVFGIVVFIVYVLSGVIGFAGNAVSKVDKGLKKMSVMDQVVKFVSMHQDYILIHVNHNNPGRIVLKTKNDSFYFDVADTGYAVPENLDPYVSIFETIARRFDGKCRRKVEEIGGGYVSGTYRGYVGVNGDVHISEGDYVEGTNTIIDLWIEPNSIIRQREKEERKQKKESQKNIWY